MYSIDARRKYIPKSVCVENRKSSLEKLGCTEEGPSSWSKRRFLEKSSCWKNKNSVVKGKSHHLDHTAHQSGRLQQALHWANAQSKFLIVSRGRPPLVHKEKSCHFLTPRLTAWLSVEHRSVCRPSSSRSSNRKTLRRRADINTQNIEQTRLLCQFKLLPELEKLRTARTNFGKIQALARQCRAVHWSGRGESIWPAMQ